MTRPCCIRVGFLAALLCVAALGARAEEETDEISLRPQQAVTFGGGDGDSFSIEQISRNDNTVTVLLRPMGETCVFRFPVMVGRSVQLRASTPAGHSLLCKATLHPLSDDGTAQFGAECNEEPISAEPKCPPEGDTASVGTYPQR